MNHITLSGNTTKQIEFKKTNEVLIATFTLGVKRNYKNKNGEYDSDFINCVAYRGTADYLHTYAQENKSYRLLLSGRLQTRSYEDNNGNKKYITEVIVSDIEILTPKEKKEEEIKLPQNIKTQYVENEAIQLRDEDLPF